MHLPSYFLICMVTVFCRSHGCWYQLACMLHVISFGVDSLRMDNRFKFCMRERVGLVEIANCMQRRV